MHGMESNTPPEAYEDIDAKLGIDNEGKVTVEIDGEKATFDGWYSRGQFITVIGFTMVNMAQASSNRPMDKLTVIWNPDGESGKTDSAHIFHAERHLTGINITANFHI